MRSGNGEFVVRGADNREMTFHTNPKTRYWHNREAGRWEDIRVGSSINAWYVPGENDRYYVDTVEVVPVEGAVQPAPAPADQFYEGQVVRVVGKDQVIIRTSDNKEITVYVNPQTTYRFNEQPATFTTLQPGVPIRVDYYMQGDRPHARGILGVRGRQLHSRRNEARSSPPRAGLASFSGSFGARRGTRRCPDRFHRSAETSRGSRRSRNFVSRSRESSASNPRPDDFFAAVTTSIPTVVSSETLPDTAASRTVFIPGFFATNVIVSRKVAPVAMGTEIV